MILAIILATALTTIAPARAAGDSPACQHVPPSSGGCAYHVMTEDMPREANATFNETDARWSAARASADAANAAFAQAAPWTAARAAAALGFLDSTEAMGSERGRAEAEFAGDFYATTYEFAVDEAIDPLLDVGFGAAERGLRAVHDLVF